MSKLSTEEQRRWRLITGPGRDSSPGEGGADQSGLADPADVQRDRCLELVYGQADGFGYASGARGGTGNPAPYLPMWLKDLRRGFPRSVVEQVQREAVTRAGWERLVLEPENLEALRHDATLVSALLALKDLVPDETKALARAVVSEVVRRIEAELRTKLLAALAGRPSPTRVTRTGPSARIDWPRTIRRSLRHYQPELETIVPDPVLFRDAERRQFEDRHVIILVDQSGSMGTSLVYASVMAAVLASLKNLSTRLLLFDTAVVDMSDRLEDPVDVLFGAQLGGGTSIQTAIQAGQRLVTDPRRTLFVIVSDLEEGGAPAIMLQRMTELRDAGVRVLCLLNLSPGGAPAYSRENAKAVAALGIPAFCCTPDRFPDVLRCVMDGRSLTTIGIADPAPEER